MTFANCPKCGSSNVTTAGVCANCGWTRFHQVMGEIEIKVTGKALLEDYKRLLFENNSLTARNAELETKIRHNALWQASEDAEERAHLEKLVLDLKKRIAELEAERRWVPVSERSPETYRPVLTVDMSTATQVPVPAFYNPDNGCWSTHFKYDLWVTHWMPLPQLPEERER